MSSIADDDSMFGSSPSGSEPNYQASLGRISGKALSANLLRNGNDLAFNTDVLYLNVNDKRIGIKTGTPTHDLQVAGTTRIADTAIVSGLTATVANIIINSSGTITTQVGPIDIIPTGIDPNIEHERVITSKLMIDDNYIKITDTNQNLEIRPTGILDVYANATVNGSVDITQNLFADQDVVVKGIVTVGDSPFDTVAVGPDFTQSIIPGDNDLYDLGTNSKRWRSIYINENIPNGGIISTTATVSDQMFFSTNTISTLQSNDDLFLTSSEGSIRMERIKFENNTITNLENTPITIGSTGRGFTQFAGTFGMLLPAGTDAERVELGVGTTRWNTDKNYLECFDGTVWSVSTGGGETVTTEIMEDLGHVYTLIFG